MSRDKIFTFSFDEQRTKKIRKAIDERGIFATQTEKQATVSKYTGKKNFGRVNKAIWGYDVIYASLERIEDTLHYINTMKLGLPEMEKQRSTFDFFDFLNNMYVVIHCIKALGSIFEVHGSEREKIERGTDCFNQLGIDGNGNDNDFFEYVRSLASVHPIDTGMHPAYHGYGKVHCSPFAVWNKFFSGRDGDINVEIYTTEKNGKIELLTLRICEFEKYLQKWIDYIDAIVEAINKFNENTVADYKQKMIKKVDEFLSYSDYLFNLKEELVVRVGTYNDDLLDCYAQMFNTKISAAANEKKFELYKNAVRYSIGFLHARLQNMDNDEVSNTGIIYPEGGLVTELYIELWKPRCLNSKINEYGYELEKMYKIDGSGGFEEQYARELLEKIKPLINKYVVFENNEPPFETQLLVSMALYFECLEFKNIINRNIPNSLDYREQVLSDDEWEVLVEDEQPDILKKSPLREFMDKCNIGKVEEEC